MRRWFVFLFAALAVSGRPCWPRRRRRSDTPIGNLGDTLRVEFKGIVADVTVHDVLPVRCAAGLRLSAASAALIQVYRANVTIHASRRPIPYAMALVVHLQAASPRPATRTYQGTPMPPTPLQYALQNAPAGATVDGGVCWDCYRDLVTNVVLLDKVTGIHLAQWNLSCSR